MAVTKIERHPKRTVLHLHEPTRYGEPDRFYSLEIAHTPVGLGRLPRLTRERLLHPANDEFMEKVVLEGVGTLVFIQELDMDYSSSTYRHGSHTVRGPFLLEPEDQPLPLHVCTQCGKSAAACHWYAEKKGESQTQVTWSHTCQQCGSIMNRWLLYPTGQEDAGHCAICGASLEVNGRPMTTDEVLALVAACSPYPEEMNKLVACLCPPGLVGAMPREQACAMIRSISIDHTPTTPVDDDQYWDGISPFNGHLYLFAQSYGVAEAPYQIL